MLKFRRTRSSDDSAFATVQPSKSYRGRMKKSAPPPPPPPGGVMPQHQPDDSAINELLEGRMDLEVILPGNKSVTINVERRIPMMDLLVQVTTAHKMTPGGHVIQVLTDRHSHALHYKPNTPIGSLDVNKIHVVPKNSAAPTVKKMPKVVNQPFEQTFRLQVNLPRKQLAVMRVSPRDSLADIKSMLCQDKSLDVDVYDLRHPENLDEPLDPSMTLSNYGLNEISLVASNRPQPSNMGFRNSSADIMAIRTKEEDKKKKGIFGFQWKRRSKSSLDSQDEDPNSRGVSPTRSDSSGGGYMSSDARSTSPNRPISYHEGMTVTRPLRPSHNKKRQAPLPPPAPSTSQENSSTNEKETPLPVQEKVKQSAPKVSHSRHSSDSSGYHEASVLSDALDSIPPTQSSSPTTSLERPIECHEHVNLSLQQHASKSLKSSVSCPNVSVPAKKRRAPAPPPALPVKEMEDIDAGLHATAMEQIEECTRRVESEEVRRVESEEVRRVESEEVERRMERIYEEYLRVESEEVRRVESEEVRRVESEEVRRVESEEVRVESEEVRVESEDVREVENEEVMVLEELEASISSERLETSSVVGEGATNLDTSTKTHTDDASSKVIESHLETASDVSVKRRGKLVRQATVNLPITEDETDWQQLEAAYSSKMCETISNVLEKIPPEKPKRKFSARSKLNRANTTNLPVTHEEQYNAIRKLSLSSEGTVNEIEACYEQTIAEAERIINSSEQNDETPSSQPPISSEAPEEATPVKSEAEVIQNSPEEKQIFKEESGYTSSTLVTQSEDQFFSAVEEISNTSTMTEVKPRSDSDASAVTYSTECSLNESIQQQVLHSTDSIADGGKSDVSSTSSDCSVDSQIHVSVPEPQTDIKVNKKSTKTSFQISTYSSESNISLERKEEEMKKPNLTNRFSSMQNLSKSETEPVKMQQEIDSTMRKVQSEINLMVSQHEPQQTDEEELDNQYQKLQEQFQSWQKQLMENQTLMESKKDEPHAEPQAKAETLPRSNKKAEAPAPTIRHKPSIKIGTWSDQTTDLHKKYKTEIKIHSEELESASEDRNAKKLGQSKPSFRISHSKIDPDIFSEQNDKKNDNLPDTGSPKVTISANRNTKAVFKPVNSTSPTSDDNRVIEKRNVMKTFSKNPSGAEYLSPQESWSKSSHSNGPVFKKRGVTTNNRGELVVKESKVDRHNIDLQNLAIQEAKNRVMAQVKNRVRLVSNPDENKNISNPPYQSSAIRRSASKGPLLESNIRDSSMNHVAPPKNVYIDSKTNFSIDDGKENVSVPSSPPPHPPPPPPVPKMINNEKLSNGATSLSPCRKKPRKIVEPKLDAREELMLAIRNFGGRTALRKV